MRLTPEDAYAVDVLRIAEKYSTAPQLVEEWPLFWVNRAIELIKAENKIAQLKRSHK